jgi:uncharacterized membrane protein YccC
MYVPGIAAVDHQARAATTLAPGRPALWLGLRVAAAVALPLAVAPWIDPLAATWASLSGYGIALVDRGGAYRVRARAMGSVAIGGIAAVAIGTLVSGLPMLAIALVTIACALCAFGQAFPPSGPPVGNTIAVHLIIAAFLPAHAGTTITAVAGYATGAMWALLLGLVVWPVHVYKPLRRAVSAALRALADYTRALATRSDRDELTRMHRVIRDRLEVARRTVVATRRGRSRESSPGERLLVIVHTADHLNGILTALEEVLDAGVPDAETATIRRALAAHADALHRVADAVLVDDTRSMPEPACAPAPALSETDGASRQVALLLSRFHVECASAVSLVDSLVTEAERPDVVVAVERTPSVLDVIRAHLDLDSAVLRHALRVGLCVLAASTIASLYHLDHGFWITLTTFVLLQPNRSATTTRAIQRGLGTIVGALFAVGVVSTISDPLALAIIIVIAAGLGASVLALNYALYSMFVTPTFILLAELHTRDFLLIEIRIAYTLLAGVIAFVASILLWPTREDLQFDEQLARALEALERYTEAVAKAVADNAPAPSRDGVAARRAFGVAINNAETSLDRVVAERKPSDIVEPRMTMVMLTRRLGSAINVFGSTRAILAVHPHEAAISAFSNTVRARLTTLAGSLRAGRSAGPWKPAATELADTTLVARRDRVEQYLSQLGEAVARATSAEE